MTEAANRILIVRLFDRVAGQIWRVGDGDAPEDWRFAYDADYLAQADAIPLSISLPLREEPHKEAVVRNWFCNLLPEGGVRDAITQRLRIAPRDDFALLAAIGGECAGAVSISDPEIEGLTQDADGEDLESLLAESGVSDSGDWALLATPRRLSLAGAQDKLAVVRNADGRLRMPHRGEPSTHILKPESLSIAGLRDLEAFGLALAKAVGLETATAEPVVVAGRKALLVERYDRVHEDGVVRRLHQEDFCQALGYPGELKYESQGGPSLKRCADLVRDQRLGPMAVQGFLDWVAITVVLGNADAHAKNLALLYDHDGRLSLAPFYDLVPTITLDARQLSRTPALRVGDAEGIDTVTAEDLKAFAAAAGYAPRYTLQRVATLAARVVEKAPSVADELKALGAGSSRLEKAVEVVGANARRVLHEAG